jgi:hypothetical protein
MFSGITKYTKGIMNLTALSKRGEEQSYRDQDLYKILNIYLKSKGIYSKIIFEEKSNLENQLDIMVCPNVVGVEFEMIDSPIIQRFFKPNKGKQTYDLFSYKIKNKISTDKELREAFFQTASNSCWANYSYLIIFECDKKLYYEMERLNDLYGVGIILLDENPIESSIIFQASHHRYDVKMIDRLRSMNIDFYGFMEQIILALNENGYFDPNKKNLDEYCDDFLKLRIGTKDQD